VSLILAGVSYRLFEQRCVAWLHTLLERRRAAEVRANGRFWPATIALPSEAEAAASFSRS
jgi:hypothetical protein